MTCSEQSERSNTRRRLAVVHLAGTLASVQLRGGYYSSIMCFSPSRSDYERCLSMQTLGPLELMQLFLYLYTLNMSLDAAIAINAMEGQIPMGCSPSNMSISTCIPTEEGSDYFNLTYSLLGLVLAALIFRLSLTYLRNEKSLPPFAPGAIPFLGHGLLFLSQPEKLAAIIS